MLQSSNRWRIGGQTMDKGWTNHGQSTYQSLWIPYGCPSIEVVHESMDIAKVVFQETVFLEVIYRNLNRNVKILDVFPR
ncbi:hypothetical protein K4L44_00370 [Halosquirtibacter laminarini]|uniref:Uncharacterized protein n=1 Tax=Halosquirtibacter laminarini TaxID=3374600 RepID=A0AC61NFJ7_9BACT|nr:hypothetical protein K4L44_00370 [Prolixibacteraceae bacterium]